MSCEVGMTKPNIKIFVHAQKKIGLDARELLYVGDSFEYDVKPALKAGWRAILLCRDGKSKDPTPTISNLSELEEMLLKINSIL